MSVDYVFVAFHKSHTEKTFLHNSETTVAYFSFDYRQHLKGYVYMSGRQLGAVNFQLDSNRFFQII